MKKMLLVFAHPDDESFFTGGTVTKYVKAGWQMERVCAADWGYAEGKLSALTPGTLEDPIYRAMETGIPNVVITFDKTGINNDPDHIKVCYATTYAFQKYASWLEELQKKFRVRSSHDESWFKRLEIVITKKIEPKLYYACMPASTVGRAVREGGLPKESFGKPWRGAPDDEITTIIDHEYYILHMEGTKEHFMGKNDQISDRL
ncbi:PIG-L family deacetylase [Candidatus Gottesmanbacteria bacterium]|nr:PIG-L family deacetylase [Candidatus Gottesmanbacteria bacterium]